ncbi:acyl-CoA reductase [Paenibacillus sp. YYML68]|uniref:acyl-CoA reductase n=1 Tax=Paenibacillus sp. YYML68 TaxID=2909250 RepID=UPI0024929F8A|nr:acyl-CoA reductase [Paenibacillus sp. YYML68]
MADSVIRPAYYVPRGIKLEATIEKHVEGPRGSSLVLQYPVLSPASMRELIAEVTERRRACLDSLRTERIVASIDAAVQRWLDPTYERRQLAEMWLPILTGYDAETVRLELKRFMRLFRRKELLRFLDEELDAASMLDEFRPRKSGGFSRAYGPELIFHVFSGNVPALPIWSLVMGLLLKSAGFGKTSSSEPLMAVLFVETLSEVDPELADCLVILPWKGGDEELEQPLLEAAEAVIVYGSMNTVEQVRRRTPVTKRFLSYGHKISFAMMGQESLTPDRFRATLRRAAEDAAVYDQQGCLSPHTLFVEEGGAVSPQQCAQLLAAELARYERKRPRAALTDEESMAIHTVRRTYELRSLQQEPVEVYASPGGTEWTVIYHGQPGFEPSPLNRTIHVVASASLEAAVEYIYAYRPYLQSVGLAVAPGRLEPMASLLGRAGVTRICAIGQMAHTTAGWHHDGRMNLVELIRWVDLERSVELDAEQYDADVE